MVCAELIPDDAIPQVDRSVRVVAEQRLFPIGRNVAVELPRQRWISVAVRLYDGGQLRDHFGNAWPADRDRPGGRPGSWAVAAELYGDYREGWRIRRGRDPGLAPGELQAVEILHEAVARRSQRVQLVQHECGL